MATATASTPINTTHETTGAIRVANMLCSRLRFRRKNATTAKDVAAISAITPSVPRLVSQVDRARTASWPVKANTATTIAAAIANAANRAELLASRARIVAAADDARRRLERNLHDGAQQQLITLALDARMAEASVPAELDDLKQQLAHLTSGLREAHQELQEISRGLHPAILSKGGMLPALKALAGRSAIPVTFDVAVDRRLPEAVEVAAYYVVAEGLTNAAKHSRASEVTVSANTDDANLFLSVQDNGIGGAHVGKGSGLIGLSDRVEALGGQIKIDCPPEGGTLLHAIPLERE